MPTLAVALSRELPADGNVPEWVELLPPGPIIHTDDGRTFQFDDPQRLVGAFSRPLPFDVEHATHLKGPAGDPAPAVGWVEELEARDNGSLWGRIEWTDVGADYVRTRAYRFVSPGFETDAQGDVVRLLSAGLTNNPAMPQLTALNRARTPDTKEEPSTMSTIAQTLGLADEATPDQLLAAVGELKKSHDELAQRLADQVAKLSEAEAELTGTRAELDAKTDILADVQQKLEVARRQEPTLATHVPRPEFDALKSQLCTLQQQVRDKAQADLEDEIQRTVGEAVAGQKITPASKDYYLAQCRKEGGLDDFRAFVSGAPVIGGPSQVEAPVTDPQDGTALTRSEVEALSHSIVSKDAYLAARQRRRALQQEGL